ncbi:MAG: amidohydrolase family protein [Burkholderiales bacterium]|nr:amidohydrolase family protein [Phycisphaerae bacterium]
MGEIRRLVRGPLLVPRAGGAVDFYPDGVLTADAGGRLVYVGTWGAGPAGGDDNLIIERARGMMMPPLLDIHTHVPQHPIRGRFVEGVPDDAPGGKLLAGLLKNVFPVEAECDARVRAQIVVREFLRDTLSHGVVGGMVYVTPSPVATEAALSILPDTWSVGLVLMNQNCPEYLRTRDATLEADVDRIAGAYGRRLVITDRFAVAVDAPLRKRGVALAARYGLRTQTHLNEQVLEKRFVEQTLYPDARSYTDVYLRDGLLDHNCVLAHCIQMRDEEWEIVSRTGSAIAHCPTSNLLLGSGVMPLDQVKSRGIPYAIATDVGASPTVSMLAEMARFIQVHAGRSAHATPSEALYRATLAPSRILALEDRFGRLEAGRDMSFIEVDCPVIADGASADDVIRAILPTNLDNPLPSVQRVTLAGRTVFERGV